MRTLILPDFLTFYLTNILTFYLDEKHAVAAADPFPGNDGARQGAHLRLKGFRKKPAAQRTQQNGKHCSVNGCKR